MTIIWRWKPLIFKAALLVAIATTTCFGDGVSSDDGSSASNPNNLVNSSPTTSFDSNSTATTKPSTLSSITSSQAKTTTTPKFIDRIILNENPKDDGDVKGDIEAALGKPEADHDSPGNSQTNHHEKLSIDGNFTDLNGTVDLNMTTTLAPTTTTTEKEEAPLPKKGAAQEEKQSSITIFFILIVLAFCILVVHLLLITKFHYLPESIAIVFLGGLIGALLTLISKTYNWKKEEAFSPTTFFLLILPPIIFESGYNLHKGNFFQNLGSIMIFAIFGTLLSAIVIGAGISLLGVAEVAYRLSLVESFAFGSLISAVDPVATLAIFSALDVDPILNMLVFGESILNDAVSIVLTSSIMDLDKHKDLSTFTLFAKAVSNFVKTFFASAAIGVSTGLVSALLLKHVDLRKTPSLEFSMMLIFCYLPYSLAEGIHLSGIMAILFCGIVMSHYTHFNLSPVTQITVQQTFRTLAFLAETAVFAYLGLAIFSFSHDVRPAFVIWSIVLCLLGRAANIFPLSFIMNYFREHKITKRMQFIMWFSGLRGAIAYALCLHIELESEEKRHVLVTTTLIIVLFTILVLGGSTMPLLQLLNRPAKSLDAPEVRKKRRKKKRKEITLSKTKEFGETIDSEQLSELTTTDAETDAGFLTEIEVGAGNGVQISRMKPHLKGFLKFDAKYLFPFFTRQLTPEELRDGKTQMHKLTNKWYQEVQTAVHSDGNTSEQECLVNNETEL